MHPVMQTEKVSAARMQMVASLTLADRMMIGQKLKVSSSDQKTIGQTLKVGSWIAQTKTGQTLRAYWKLVGQTTTDRMQKWYWKLVAQTSKSY